MKEDFIQKAKLIDNIPLPKPVAFLANPADGGVDLVWERGRDMRVGGYELQWKHDGGREWHVQSLPDVDRWQLTGLENGSQYQFRLRARSQQSTSDWTLMERVVPGTRNQGSLLSFASGVSIWLMLRMVLYSLRSVIKAHMWRTR